MRLLDFPARDKLHVVVIVFRGFVLFDPQREESLPVEGVVGHRPRPSVGIILAEFQHAIAIRVCEESLLPILGDVPRLAVGCDIRNSNRNMSSKYRKERQPAPTGGDGRDVEDQEIGPELFDRALVQTGLADVGVLRVPNVEGSSLLIQQDCLPLRSNLHVPPSGRGVNECFNNQRVRSLGNHRVVRDRAPGNDQQAGEGESDIEHAESFPSAQVIRVRSNVQTRWQNGKGIHNRKQLQGGESHARE